MTVQYTPEWIKELSLSKSVDTQDAYPDTIDGDILHALEQLSLEELDTLADSSGVREHQGTLTPSNNWSREQYIEVLSNIGEMTQPQVDRIRSHLGIQK